jgi:hypothetical protein
MKIDYKIEEVKPNVFAVVVPDGYHRAMLFCRVQEFYESPNEDFRGKNFSIWDYIEWYSREHNNTFTYTSDWSGFNIPLKTAWDCYEKLREHESPYDTQMESIIRTIELRMFHKKSRRNWNAYIIGAANTEGNTFQHEICHGLYATNKEYKQLVDEITLTIPTKDYQSFRNNLIDMGYTDKVIDDEIQAYLAFGHDYKSFTKGVSQKVCNELNKQYINVFNNF